MSDSVQVRVSEKTKLLIEKCKTFLRKPNWSKDKVIYHILSKWVFLQKDSLLKSFESELTDIIDVIKNEIEKE